MASQFDYFVVFAEMRTGSNFLENNLKRLPEIDCFGELFNPHFIGAPNKTSLLGFTAPARDKDPEGLLHALRTQTDKLSGFRYFHDHHPAVVEAVLDDPRCAKIILTRNPVDRYVSWQIAESTGQWILTNVAQRRTQKAVFSEDEFLSNLNEVQSFQQRLLQGLQKRGQTAFYVDYDDIQDLDVVNGIAAFLGVSSRLDGHDTHLKRQNPSPLQDKVENYDEMVSALSRVDWANLGRTPNFEPRRAPAVPSYVAAQEAPLMFMPLPSGPSGAVQKWLAALDGGSVEGLQRDFSQKTLRQWKNRNTPHRSFTVVRHPVARLYRTYCDRIFDKRPGAYLKLRHAMIDDYGLTMPRHEFDDGWTVAQHRDSFLKFLDFVKLSLGGQTAIRLDGTWATQAQVIQGFADFATPDMVVREDRMTEDLGALCAMLGLSCPDIPSDRPDTPFPLADIYNDDVEEAVRQVHQRDYMMFGFGPLAL